MNMNTIKDFLITFALAMLFAKGVEYFFFSRQKAADVECVRPGESFIAPKSLQRPLNTEIDFVDQKAAFHDEKTQIETDHAYLVFSSHGASLDRLEFKRGAQGDITTVFPVATPEKEKRCFLIGFDDRTPYYYSLVSRLDHEDRIELTYQADFYAGRIQKIFTVFKSSYRIDLTLNIMIDQGDANNTVTPRVFYSAPIMPTIIAHDVPAAVVNDEQNNIVTHARKTLQDRGWFTPTFFGAENRYFVHAMVTDNNHFTQRGYYALFGVSELSAILEGPSVTTSQAWTLSFYFGPKERPAMALVDPRLEQTLGFTGWSGGILSPIAGWLLKLLNLLYYYLGNYGLAIIALTALIKLILLPFSYKSTQNMKKNGEIQNKLRYLQQKYKDNPERLAQERVELMRKEGMPGLSGCLPILLQLPIFFALSRLLTNSIELYQAPFAVWSDLSAPDRFYILPILIVLVMLLQATTVDPKQRMTMVIPAIVLGAFSTTLPAGLCLYILVSTFLGVLQPLIQNKLKIA